MRRRGSRRRSPARAALAPSRAPVRRGARATRVREQLVEHLRSRATSPGGTKTPVTSTSPPTAVATTGRPCAIASRATTP